MFNTVYVLERDPAECRWIESALAGQVRKLIFLEDGATLLDWLATQGAIACFAAPSPMRRWPSNWCAGCADTGRPCRWW